MMARAHVAAFALPIAFALAIFASTAANGRDGRGPTTLTEREVTVAPRTDDRSIAEVWLGWSEPVGRPGTWMSRQSLEALGFDFDVDPSAVDAAIYYRRQLSRRAFVAFEINGPAWERIVAERAVARGAGEPPRAEQVQPGQRLVPVDLDRNADALARRYPDVRTHLITAAVVSVGRFEFPGDRPYVGGALINVDPRRIQIPVELSRALPVRAPTEREAAPFTVSLTYGRRWEPWVADIRLGLPR